MNYEDAIMELLLQVESGRVPPGKALDQLRSLPFSDLGFAKVDHHRELRQGLAEVVYCEGKTPEQVRGIVGALLEKNKGNILLTRAGPEIYDVVRKLDERAAYHPEARAITVERDDVEPFGLVSIVSAGTADMPVAQEALVTASIMGSRVERFYDVGVAGVHRLLNYREPLERSNAIVVVAGMEGALASVVGGLVPCPVIAVPTSVGYGASFGGLAALLAMVNSCAAGVSVVNIDNGFGAGYMAGLINRMVDSGGGNR
ncbi:MAG: nickel pincer cofactor biosynthesis protein LarB [Actinobacteria bacterium]|nr:nickel pincer cofactor biosynthesis protein LarB [Actinomycetota bacterium]MCG2794411.1 nickel pincer cofactor biosynthesis protein LarB [Actinomycetes bacterium]MBU4240341.1 nickel pincer cofactor biosynthesis protein LarB [Actinomycetota bacterium]MBU4301481.1 nickel pincer cofactor biosynthesis protein LarB [Actinomycetota bacterium]MBU4385758.1 nickel pincer cofactor biosynthesis protein LarB [Actinomycetota bacterium]